MIKPAKRRKIPLWLDMRRSLARRWANMIERLARGADAVSDALLMAANRLHARSAAMRGGHNK